MQEPMKLSSLASALCCSLMMLAELDVARADAIYWPSALDLAKQRSGNINCVNNLKNLVLAAEGWAYDNGDQFPANFQTFSNYLDSPAPLFCPADLSRPAVTNWSNFDWSGIAYQWIAQPNWGNPDAVCCRCRIHDNVAFVSGTVLQ